MKKLTAYQSRLYYRDTHSKTTLKQIDWITQTLVNDECSLDEDMADYFKREGGLDNVTVDLIMEQREDALACPLHFKLSTIGMKFKD